MTEAFDHDGVTYYPIPDHHPLAVSKQGRCINLETKRERKWTKTKNKGLVFQMAHVPRNANPFGITIQRALALCFIPIPEKFKAVPIEKLRVSYTNTVNDFQQAIDLNTIRWELRNKNTAIITDTVTKAVTVCDDFSAASLKLSHNSNLIHGLRMAYGNRFVYKHYQVEIYTRK